ncbi:hypothetical protein ACMHYB_38860 [Sorangium sp. So ce1128]
MKITKLETFILSSPMPPDTFTFQENDEVRNSIDPVGTLVSFASL